MTTARKGTEAPKYQQSAKAVVAYLDGTVEEFNPNRPRLLLDMEDRFGVQSPETHEQVFWLAHHALVTLPAKANGTAVKDFDEWLDTVDEVDTVDLREKETEAKGEGRSSKG